MSSGLSIEDHCRDLYARTFGLWRSLEGQYPTWKCRFSILFGPPVSRPDLLILGANPGFSEADLYDEEVLTWPERNEYATQDWLLARTLRTMFQSIGLQAVLDRSVGTNRLFFKSKSLGPHKSGLGWADNPPWVRSRLEAYCEAELDKLVQSLEPRAILVLGLSVFDRYVDDPGRTLSSGNRRVGQIGTKGTISVLGIMHPTGARMSNSARAVIADGISNLLGRESRPAVASPKRQNATADDLLRDPDEGNRKPVDRQSGLKPSTRVRAGIKPPESFGYRPIHDFWRELSKLGEIEVADFHRHLVSIKWQRPRGGALTYEVTRTDVASMCKNGFAVRADGPVVTPTLTPSPPAAPRRRRRS